MIHCLYLAWRYLAHNRFKTAVLVLSITLIVYVPSGLRILIGRAADQLTARAAATPLLLGSRGSPLELVLQSLYFDSSGAQPTNYGELERVEASGFAQAIPLHLRFNSQGRRIVGTSLDYFEFRGLKLAAGRSLTTLGDCILGAEAATEWDLAPGDKITSAPETVFDLAGVYPLRMQVVGVLAATGTADDSAVFVDIKTAWVIEGLGHGHVDLEDEQSAESVLSRDGNQITANAALRQYAEVTLDNASGFHFHGDRSDYPLSAVIALPFSDRDAALLQGRYQAADEFAQILRPIEVMDQLLGTVFTIENYVVAALVFVSSGTVLTACLVFLLSLRLRRREIETMIKIGGSRMRIRAVLAMEMVFVLGMSLIIAGALILWTGSYAGELVRAMALV